MIRNIRKAISVICAVALLLSLCAVSFTGVSSAAPIAKEDQTIETWQTVLETLTMDNNKGIAGCQGNKGAYVDVGGDHGTVYSIDAVSSTSAQVGNGPNASVADTDAFALEANKTYRITFEYKYLAGSTSYQPATGKSVRYIGLVWGNKLENGGSRAKFTNSPSLEFNDSNSTLVEIAGKSARKLTNDSEWMPYSCVFTTSTDYSSTYNANRTQLLIQNDCDNSTMGGNVNHAVLYIDNIKIEVSTGSKLAELDNEYTFDWKDGETPINTATVATAIGGSTAHFNFSGLGKTHADTVATAEGLMYSFSANNSFTTASYGWNHNACVWDEDAVVGGRLYFKTNTTYLITVKYKVTDKGSNASVGLAIAANKSTVGAETLEIAQATHTTNSTDWEYLTACFSTADLTSVVGKPLWLAARASASQQAYILVESVTVNEVRFDEGVGVIEKTVDGEKSYEYYAAGTVAQLGTPENDRPEDRGFTGWSVVGGSMIADYNAFTVPAGLTSIEANWKTLSAYVTLDDGKTVTTTKLGVDTALPSPVRPDGNLFFEGWYDFDPTTGDYGTKYTKVPDQDITLYAKYNGTYLSFDNLGYTDYTKPDSYADPAIVADPDDPTNNVLYMQGKAESNLNIMLPNLDVVGSKPFELKTNTKYYISFKVKTSVGSDAFSMSVYRGDASVYSPTTTTRTSLNISGVATKATETSTGEWVTVSGTFETGDSHYLERTKWSYQNHLFILYWLEKDKSGYIYLDDVVVAEVMDEAPEGATSVTFRDNVNGDSVQYGFPGEAITMPATPVSGSGIFLGWYLDKKFTSPFKGGNFATTDLTVYAKWEASPFLVDFDDYEQGAVGYVSARFKLENKNGNNYVNWTRENTPDSSSYSDSGTPYRVFLNKGGKSYAVEKGLSYTITFKYKLLEGTIKAQPVTCARLNGWSNANSKYDGISLTQVNADEWQTASISFIADPLSGGAYVSLGLAGHGHVLVDDVTILGSSSNMNLYGSRVIKFVTNSDDTVDPIAGEPGEKIELPKNPVRTDYSFAGWYTDSALTTPFTDKVFSEDEESITLYGSWILGRFNESYEEFPNSVMSLGVSGAYKLYKAETAGNDKANIQNGSVSVFRDGTTTGTKAITLCRDTSISLVKGKQYTLTFYVKPTNVTDASGSISLIGMKTNTGINSPENTNIMKTVGELKVGEWQKVEYTFTAESDYIGITTTAGNDMYFDNFTVKLVGFVDGGKGGDSSVNPALIALMVILAAGSLVITGKKVFEK